MNPSVTQYMLFIYSTVEKKEVTFTPRFLGIDEANNFANLLRAILPKHGFIISEPYPCLLYTSPSPRDLSTSRMPSSA